MATITHRGSWPLDNQEVRMGKGPLVTVKHPDGHLTKMYQQDAIAAGLIAAPKAQPQPANKMQPAEANKTVTSPDGQPNPEADDLTTIPGVGLGVARSLAARGVTTFAALRAASDLSYLSKRAQAAVEEWRKADG
jgi:predicted flap endonuclease-1-like 5' DNA nuclease